MLAVCGEMNGQVGECAERVEKALGRDCHAQLLRRAVALELDGHVLDDRYLEIRGTEPQFVAVAIKENALQNGQGALGRNGAVDGSERLQQLGARGGELHRSKTGNESELEWLAGPGKLRQKHRVDPPTRFKLPEMPIGCAAQSCDEAPRSYRGTSGRSQSGPGQTGLRELRSSDRARRSAGRSS